MYLKSVEMQGFKSFADKIYLDFNPGITAIVGPNGSGKSNISDAIRWVMGEQSIKTLRGSRMEDVIFAGTEKRKPQGFAEVSLTLDNSEHIFPVDFEEVTVTRRVYRSGEGEYFINKASCRLKDIHELFMDTGLGREGYSIIGQGKIDEILSTKSEDRRQIFEEASGITKYKYRKIESERKLEKTNDNLTRVRDIMTELEGQLEPLRIQSEKAKKYLNLRETLKTVEVDASVARIDGFKAELKEIDGELEAVSGSIDEMQTEADKIERQTNEMYEKIGFFEHEAEKCREEQKDTVEKINGENNRINIYNANIGHCRENIERINSELEKSVRGMSQLDELLAEHAKVLENYRAEAERISADTSAAEEQFEKINAVFEEKNENIEEIKSEIISKTSQIGALKSKILNYNILLENFRAGYEKAQSSLDENRGSFENAVRENKELKDALKNISAELESAKAAAANAEVEFRKKNDEHRAANEKKNSLLALLSQKNSRRGALEDLENDFDGYNRSVKAVMTAYKQGRLRDAEIHGPLSSLVSTDKRYVTAIETALASVGQNIVTGNERDAKFAIEYLKQNRLGRATFMPISTVKPRGADISPARGLKGYIAAACELVEYDGIYDGIIKNVLGATVVADNIDNAIAMAAKCGHRFRIVTLDGDVMQPGGAMSGGSSGKNSGVLSRAAEIESLKEDISVIKEQLAKLEKNISEKAEEASQSSVRLEKLRTEISDKNGMYIKIKSDFEHSEKYLAEYNQSRSQLVNEIETIEKRVAEINSDIERCGTDISGLEAEIEGLRGESDGKQSETDRISEQVRALQEKLLSLSIEKSTNVKDIELQNERISAVRDERRSIAAENDEKRTQLNEFEEKIEELSRNIETSRLELEKIKSDSKELDERLNEMSEKRHEADSKSKELQQSLKEINEKLFSIGQQKVKIEAKKSKTETELDGIFSYLWEEYELTYSEAAKLKRDGLTDIKQAAGEIASLKGKIKALGNINIDAIEEYKDVRERFDFLTEQTRDLEKAKGELEKIIDEMLEIMQSRFSEQFRIISKNFNAVFRELFGGGQANLILADPDDLLGSGIEIEAQPPGKKLQSLTLLSGGERAFTAIALLFAILKVRPTPFCILDEIEAALDDVNVYRYAEYLKKYCGKTQFIVVTHRRGTMEAANILYGVTMQERGISKLLSLNIDEVTE